MGTAKDMEPSACDQCYRRKLACSKTEPSCERCTQTGSACTYSLGKFMGKPKKRLQAQRSATPPFGAQAAERCRFTPQAEPRSLALPRSSAPVSRPRLSSSGNASLWQSGFSSEHAVDSYRKRKHLEVDQDVLGSFPETRTVAAVGQDPASEPNITPTLTHSPGRPHHKRHQSYPSLLTPLSPLASSLEPRFPVTPIFFDHLPTPVVLNDASTKENVQHDDSDFHLADWTDVYIPTYQLGPSLSADEDSPPLRGPAPRGTVPAAGRAEDKGPRDVGKESEANGGHCDCVPRALHMASELHGCLETSQKDALGTILSTCRTAVELCKHGQQCVWAENHLGVLLSINMAIMELVAGCYDAVSLNSSQYHSTVILKFREMELDGFLSPHVMKAVVDSERKQAAATCIMLGSICRGPQKYLWLDQFARIFDGLATSFTACEERQ